MKIFTLIIMGFFLSSCLTLFPETSSQKEVYLPFFKNSAQECYFLDEFMPQAQQMAKGKRGGIYIRRYTYTKAHYKDWSENGVVLSFYSQDGHCWSLYEEWGASLVSTPGSSLSDGNSSTNP